MAGRRDGLSASTRDLQTAGVIRCAAVTLFHLDPETDAAAFAEAGFRDFRWLGVSLDPAERGDPVWDGFLGNPPVIAFTATRP